MPLSIPPSIISAKNKIDADGAWLALIDVVVSPTITHYICSNTEDIVFDGHTYRALPFEFDPQSSGTDGALPSINLKVTDVSGAIQNDFDEAGGCVGAEATIRIYNSAHPTANNEELSVTYSVIGAKVGLSNKGTFIVISLGPSSILRRRFPKHRTLEDHCEWAEYFGKSVGVECGYDESAFSSCSGTYEACTARERTKYFGGAKGLTDRSWRPA